MNHSKGFSISAVVGLLGAAMPIMSAQAVTPTAQEQANIKVVADFYAALDERDAAGGESKRPIRPIAEKYLAANYKQMGKVNGSEPGGRERFIKSASARAGGITMEPAKVLYIGAAGDMVVRVSTRGETSIWNMFRLQNSQLAEHWDGWGGQPLVVRQNGGGGPPGAGGAPPGGR